MSEVNEIKIEEQSDIITIKLEEMKEPNPLETEFTSCICINDSDCDCDSDNIKDNNKDIIKKIDVSEKIEIKPENVLIDGIEHLYSYMKCVHSEKITPTNIIVIATELMQIVEKYKGLTGPQKKMLVINVIKKAINSQIDSQETRNILNTIIDFTLPSVIDNLVDAINGNIKFNKEKVQSFFKKYICCCIKNQS
jgi:hypothetical protein